MKVHTPRSLAAAVAAFTLGSICGYAPSAAAHDDDHNRGQITTRLSGFNEVHFVAGPPAALRGAVSTKATGRFRAAIHDRRDMIEYELNYAGLEGTVTQSHIHFGQAATVGGIVVWLCQTAGTPAPAAVAAVTPLCPQDTVGGPVTGTITPANVIGPAGQGIAPGEFRELVDAIEADTAYVNVHTDQYQGGEIRGQLR